MQLKEGTIIKQKPSFIMMLFYTSIILILLTNKAFSADHNPTICEDLVDVPANDSIELFEVRNYERSAEFIDDCILKGSDPPARWVRYRGRSRGAFKGISGVTTLTGQGGGLCAPTTVSDNMRCEDNVWPNCHGTPGGIQGDGGESCEKTGDGEETPRSNVGPIETSREEVTVGHFECMLNLTAGLGLGANNSVCLSAGAELCGFDLGGQLCLGGDDGREEEGNDQYVVEGFAQYNDVQRVVIGEGISDTNGSPHLDGTTIFPEGGEITSTEGLLIDGEEGDDDEPITLEPGATIVFDGNTIKLFNDGEEITIEKDGGGMPEVSATANGGVALVSLVEHPVLPAYAGQ